MVHELIKLDQWVAWKAVKKDDGKTTKIPINSHNGKNASTNDSKTWGSYDEAKEYYEKNKDIDIAGVGFVFTEDDPFCGIDLDNCRDPHSGTRRT